MWLALLLTASVIARNYWAPGNQTWDVYAFYHSVFFWHTHKYTQTHTLPYVYTFVHKHRSPSKIHDFVTFYGNWWCATSLMGPQVLLHVSVSDLSSRKLDASNMTGRNSGVKLNKRDNNSFPNSDTGSLHCCVLGTLMTELWHQSTWIYLHLWYF